MSSINVDLTALKDAVKSNLKTGLRNLNSSSAKIMNIKLPDGLSSSLAPIVTSINDAKNTLDESIQTIEGKVNLIKDIENSSKRFVAKLDERYRVKEPEVKDSNAPAKVEKADKINTTVDSPTKIDETINEQSIAQVNSAESVEEKTIASNVTKETGALVTENIEPSASAAPILANDNVEKETGAKPTQEFNSSSNAISNIDNGMADLKVTADTLKEKPNFETNQQPEFNTENVQNGVQYSVAASAAARHSAQNNVLTPDKINSNVKKIMDTPSKLVDDEVTLAEKLVNLIERLVLMWKKFKAKIAGEQYRAILPNWTEGEYTNDELNNLNVQITDMRTEIETLEAEKSNYYNMMNGVTGVTGNAQLDAEQRKIYEEKYLEVCKKLDEKYAKLVELEAQRSELIRKLQDEFYNKFKNAEDYEELSNINNLNDIVVSERYSESESYLNEDQKKLYAYLYRKEGYAAAEEYLTTQMSIVNHQKGLEQALEFLDPWILKGEDGKPILDENGSIQIIESDSFYKEMSIVANAFGSGFLQHWKGYGYAAQDALGQMDYVLSADDYEQMFIMSLLAEGDKTQYVVANTIGNMASPIVVGAIATHFCPLAGQTISKAMLGVSSYGNTLKETYSERVYLEDGKFKFEDGKEYDKAQLYAVLTAGSEVALESVLGGIPGLKSLNNIQVKNVATFVANSVVNIPSEAVEETTQLALDKCLRSVIFGEEIDITLDEVSDTAVTSMITSAIMNAGIGSVSIGSKIASLNVDTARINEPSYRQAIMEALDYKVSENGDFNNLSEDAKVIANEITIKEAANQNTTINQAEVEEVYSYSSHQDPTIEFNESSTDTTSEIQKNTIIENMKNDVDSQAEQIKSNIIADEISYDQMLDNQKTANSQSEEILFGAAATTPIDIEFIEGITEEAANQNATVSQAKVEEVYSYSNHQDSSIEFNEQNVPKQNANIIENSQTTEVSSPTLEKVSKAVEAVKQSVDNRADNIKQTIERQFESIKNSTSIDATIGYDSAKSVNDINVYAEKLINDLPNNEMSYEEVINNNQSISNSSGSVVEEILFGAAERTPIDEAYINETNDIYSYTEHRVNTGQDFTELKNEINNLESTEELADNSSTAKIEQLNEVDSILNSEINDTNSSSGNSLLIDKTDPEVLGLPASSFSGILTQAIPGAMTVIPSIFENVESVVVDATNIIEKPNENVPKIENLEVVEENVNLNTQNDLMSKARELMEERYNSLLEKSKNSSEFTSVEERDLYYLERELREQKSLTELLESYKDAVDVYGLSIIEIQIRELIKQNPEFKYTLKVDDISKIQPNIFQFFNNDQISFEIAGTKMTSEELTSIVLNNDSIPKLNGLKTVLKARQTENLLDGYNQANNKQAYLINLGPANVISLFKSATDSEIADIINTLDGTYVSTSIISGLTFEQFNAFAKNEQTKEKAYNFFSKLQDRVQILYLSHLDEDLANEWFEKRFYVPYVSFDFVRLYEKLTLENKKQLIENALYEYKAFNDERKKINVKQLITLVDLTILENNSLLKLTELFPKIVSTQRLTSKQARYLNSSLDKKIKIEMKEEHGADFIILNSSDLKVKDMLNFVNGEMKKSFERVIGSKWSSKWDGDLLERIYFQSFKKYIKDIGIKTGLTTMGYNSTNGSYINCDLNNLKFTVSHETIHEISRGEHGDCGFETLENWKEFRGINESVTEYLNKLLYEDNNSKVSVSLKPSSGYDLGVQKIRLMVKYGIINHSELVDAYMSNNSNYWRSICESDEEFKSLLKSFNSAAVSTIPIGAINLDKFIIKKRLEQRRNGG